MRLYNIINNEFDYVERDSSAEILTDDHAPAELLTE
jgi:hypothetical protein